MELVKAATVKNTVMWVMTPCSEVDLYGRFGGTAINFSRLYGVACQRTAPFVSVL